MKKLILRLFLPAAEDIAKMAVDLTANFVNESGKEDVIAKYGTYADEFTKVQSKITTWLRDGKIDNNEKAELYRDLLPLAQKLIEEIKR